MKFFEKVQKVATENYTKYKGELRYGQCLSNAALDLADTEELVSFLDEIRGTDNDPFYSDKNISNFFNELIKL